MKLAIVATLLAGAIALPISATVSAAAPLGSITIKGGGQLVPGQQATVDVMCPEIGTTASGAPLLAPVASIWLATPQGLHLVWQVSSQEPGSCVWISGTDIAPHEMPTEVTLNIPSYAPPGKTQLVALDYHGDLVARASVVVAGAVTKPDPTPNPYLTVPTGATGKAGKGAKTLATTPSTSTATTSMKSVVRVVAPRGKTPWWKTLLKRVLGIF